VERKTVLVTGSLGGIGEAICLYFAKKGYSIISVDRKEADTAKPRESALRVAIIWDNTGFIDHYELDITDPEACSELAQQTGPVDILVNNAGITRDRLFVKVDRDTGAIVDTMSVEDWRAVMAVNLDAPMYMTRAFLPQMVERKSGVIVNIASVNGQRPQIGQTNYGTSKAGLLHFTRTLAAEVARYGVRVNAVAPGYTDTPMVQAMPERAREAMIGEIPMRRLALAEEIARSVYVAATEEYYTGSVFTPNGGLHMP